MITTAQANKAARRIKTAYSWAKEKDDAVNRAILDQNITEEAFDALLDAEDRALDKLADAIHEGTGGAVTEAEAQRLARFNFDRLGELVARLQI